MDHYAEEKKYWIWLASLNPGAKTFYQILKTYGTAASFFETVNDGPKPKMLSDDIWQLARASCTSQRVNELMAELESKSISVLTRLDDAYPEVLTHIPWPPPVLFVRGSLPSFDNAVGIVGTRRCTRRGYEFTRRLAADLGSLCVVSGLARGIDTAAHLGALDAQAPTVAVLGCGVDVVYPPENDELYRRIVENGAVISELPPGAAPYMGNFPVRNRVIAGLSRGLIVVESEIKGGTSITASLAVQYGRDVFAVPGPPYMDMAQLPNALIAAGAVPVRSAADVRRCFGLSDTAREPAGPSASPQLDLTQAHIYEQLRKEDLTAEGVAAYTGLSANEVSTALTMMELSGIIRRLPGGRYGV